VPVITVCQNGMSMGFAPRKNDHARAKRGLTQGWTKTATRSNRKFLWTVKCPDLGDNGHSFTLTLKDCPPTAADWTKIRRAFQKRLERLGAIRMHWLTEWQRRGVPHLHGCVWFPPEVPPYSIIHHWLEVSAKYGSSHLGQDTKPIVAALGWLRYLAKHADRGVFNYQRAAASIPEGWKGATGRMWGHIGDWPVTEPQRLVISSAGGYALRRIAKGWRLAQARTDPDPDKRRSRITSARNLFQNSKRDTSSILGSAEWLPLSASRVALVHLANAGYDFEWSADEKPELEMEPVVDAPRWRMCRHCDTFFDLLLHHPDADACAECMEWD
jgi:hypothetical protein